MNSMKAAVVLALFLLGIVGAITLWSDRPMTLSRPAFRRAASPSPVPRFEGPKKIVVLFFRARNQKVLQEETREILGATSTTEEAKRTLEELMKGPEGDLLPTVPQAARVRNLFIDSSGTAYADFDRELREGQPGGAQEELYAVFSIVDTLASNFPPIKRIQILVEGAEMPTIAGGVDTRAPLAPRYVF